MSGDVAICAIGRYRGGIAAILSQIAVEWVTQPPMFIVVPSRLLTLEERQTPQYTSHFRDAFDGFEADGETVFVLYLHHAYLMIRCCVPSAGRHRTVVQRCAALVLLQQDKRCRISFAVRCLSVPCECIRLSQIPAPPVPRIKGIPTF